MATKQELQESIKKMVVVANNPKTSEAIRKTLLKSIEKAESQVKELEKAETLEKKEEELTEKQEQKVEAVKEESKKLVQSLKGKIKTAKSSGAKTKKSTPPSSKLMQKAKELARKYRTAQKGVPTGDFDIERDAGRPAMPKGKRTAKKSGKTYYENRENRIDRKQPPKTYPKLADGGMTAEGNKDDKYFIYKESLKTLEELKKGKDVRADDLESLALNMSVNVHKQFEKEYLESSFAEISEADKNLILKKAKAEGIIEIVDGKVVAVENEDEDNYAKGGKISNFGTDKGKGFEAYQGSQGAYKDGLILKPTKNMQSIGANLIMEIDSNKKYTWKLVKNGKVLAKKSGFNSQNDAINDYLSSDFKDGGMMANGGWYVVSAKDGKVVSSAFKSENEAKKYMYELFEKNDDFSLAVKKMASGGMMAKGGFVVVNLGGDRYDGGVAYQIMKGDKIVKEGLIDGDHGVEFEGKKYDGLKSLADGIGAKLVTQKMEYGGILLPMTGGVNADPRFDIYDTGAFMKKGGAVKRAMRFEDGGMNVGGDNEYLIMYRSDNPTYQNEDGFEGNPPDSMYADSPFDVLDYLRDNMPDDVELISIEEASDVYKKGGSLQSIKNKYEENEDENAHSENVVLLAKHFGTKEELAEAKKILSIHNKEGHLSTENGQKRRELHLKLIEKAREQMSKEGIEFEYGGILQPMTGGVNADPRFDIYSPDFMAKGGYMADGGEIKKLWKIVRAKAKKIYDDESYVVYLSSEKDKLFKISEYDGIKPYSVQASYDGTLAVRFSKGDYQYNFTNSVSEKKEDRESFEKYGGIIYVYIPLTNEIASEILSKVMGGYMADGGLVKVKWSDAEYGDSARVIAENKMGLILKPYGQKFHLKFPDGTEKTYTAKELEFYKEESYKKGGKTNEQSENLQMLKNQSKEFGHHAKELQTALKSNPKVDAWVVAKSERASTDLSDITHYLDGMKNTMAMGGQIKKYADWVDKKNELEKEISKLEKSIDADYSDKEVGKLTKEKREKLDDKKEELKRHLKEGQYMAMGGVTEHGLKEGDEIVVAHDNIIVVLNKKTGESAFINIETGKREDATYLKDKLMMMSSMENGGKVSLEKMYENFREQAMAVRVKIATLIGIDRATKYLDRDLVVNPFSLIESAVRKGFITIDEINNNVWDAAVSESNSIEESYRDSGEGIGSSDMNAFISSMLNDAGIKVGVKDNTYQRMAKGGKVKFRVSEIEVGDYVNFGDYGNYYVANTDFDELGGGSYFWVTKDKEKRNKSNASGKTMHKSDAEYIVEKYSDAYEMAKGGKVKFADKVASIKKSLLERKKVPKAVQKDYGKTFSPAEAEDSAKRIVGAKTYAERIKYLAKKNKK